MNKKKLNNPKADRSRDEKINEALAMLKHKDLQRECVLRGLDFEKVVEYDHHKLANFFYLNFEVEKGTDGLLDAFDKWIEEQLVNKGYKKGDAILHPSLRLGVTHLEDIKDDRPSKALKPVNENSPIVNIPKTKREKDPVTGVYTGTKKNLTYTLAKAGKSFGEIVKAVKDKFPDAQEKSIKIWQKRALKGEE